MMEGEGGGERERGRETYGSRGTNAGGYQRAGDKARVYIFVLAHGGERNIDVVVGK